VAREAGDPFWADRDIQCGFDTFRETPRVHVIAGWNDMFLAQSLKDFQAASEATNGAAKLTIYTGGHFGVVFNHGLAVSEETKQWYRQYLTCADVESPRAAVQMQLIQEGEEEEWLECDTWPPPAEPWRLFLHPGDAHANTGSLEASSPSAGTLGYVYDPKDPTPYVGNGWLNLQKDGAQDQRAFESSRSDVAVLTSVPLEQPCELVGDVTATLFLSCTAPECDIIARLCVVRNAGNLSRGNSEPGFFDRLLDPRGLGRGRSVNLCEGIVRAKFDTDSVRLEVSLGPTAVRLNVGDCIRLHVCSAAHPRWLRHPLQDTGEDWLLGTSEVGAPAEITIFADEDKPSHLNLPLRSAAVRSCHQVPVQ